MRLPWWLFASLLIAAGCAEDDAGHGQKADPQVAGRSGGRRPAADGGESSVADGGVMQGSAKAPEPRPDPAPDAGVMRKPAAPEKPAPAADSGNPPCDV
ncbi:MAG TPA: hypothetical protein VJV78_27995, partial [Polyangiales bacterium]|nr:hypothetical protein [Polyangiales bacterium]